MDEEVIRKSEYTIIPRFAGFEVEVEWVGDSTKKLLTPTQARRLAIILLETAEQCEEYTA